METIAIRKPAKETAPSERDYEVMRFIRSQNPKPIEIVYSRENSDEMAL